MFFKSFVIIFVYFSTFVECQDCDSSQQQSTLTCLQTFYEYVSITKDMIFNPAYSYNEYDRLNDYQNVFECTVISTLANCLRASNLIGCVTGPVFSSILSNDYTVALSNGTVARSMNCTNNSNSIADAIHCLVASEGDAACMINTTNRTCESLHDTLNCRLPKAKRECGLFAAYYACQNLSSMGDCGTGICDLSVMDFVSMDKQMLYASGGRNTMSIILGLIIIAFSLNF